MEVGVLGPLTVHIDGGEPHLARKERVILARLALAGGRSVSADALIDVVWGDAPPVGARSTLQGYIYRLRRTVGNDGVERRDDGYALGPGWRVDVDEVAADAAAAQSSGDLAVAVVAIERALARFRGEPYADLADVDAVRGERRRLEEVRRRLADQLVELELRRGRHAEVVARLELIVDTDSTDERAWAQLVRALGGAGRQADALAAFSRARRSLASELGIEPGPLLRDAEQAVLLQHVDATPAGNLPPAIDSFVGRHAELHSIATALDQHRLVTLVGPGGTGKTRLAIEAARHHVDRGAWLVELAAVVDPTQVAGTIVGTLGCGGIDALPRIVAGRDVLVVVDNCEHVLEAAASTIVGLLSACPTVRVLATSRTRLHLRGEQVVDVHPLDPRAEGTELFLDRAEAASSTFDRAEARVDDVLALCQRLDGLPLALEIAAAQLRWLSLPELVERLDRRFRAMTSAEQNVDERQRTLDAVIAWSVDLLVAADQVGLRRLAILPDTFNLATAEALLGDAAPLARLVDASLVAVSPAGQQPRRYSILATIREYLIDQRDALAEGDDVRRALAQWADHFVTDVEAAIRTPRQDEAMRLAAAERLNLGAALDAAEALGDPTLALRLAAAVPLGAPADRERLISRLVSAADEAPASLRARAHATLANLALDRGDAAAAIAAAEACGAAAAADGDRAQQAWALYFLALGRWTAGEVEQVDRLLRQGLDEFDALGLPDGTAYLHWIGALVTDDLADAARRAEAATAAFRALDMPFGLAHALEAAALVGLRAGDAGRVAAQLTEAITIVSAADEAGCTAHCLEAVAAHTAEQGWVDEAAELLAIADALRRSTGYGHRVWEDHGHRRAVAALEAAGVSIPGQVRAVSVEDAARRALALLNHD